MIYSIFEAAKKTLFIIFSFFIVSCSPPPPTPPKDIDRLSFEEVKALAETGNAVAQCRLGTLYYFPHCSKGQVKKDVEQAARWYRKSADQGNAEAQSHLAHLYLTGGGVPEDLIQAYKWMLLSEWGGHKKDSSTRKFLELRRMSKDQIGKANELATEFVPVSSKK